MELSLLRTIKLYLRLWNLMIFRFVNVLLTDLLKVYFLVDS